MNLGQAPHQKGLLPPDITHALSQIAQQHPEDTAIIDARNSAMSLSYAKLDQLCWDAAAGFLAHNIHKNSRVAVMIPPSVEFFVTTYALLRVGAIPVFIDPAMGLRRVRSCLLAARTDGFIGTSKANLAALLCAWPRGKAFVVSSKGFPWSGLGVTNFAKLVDSNKHDQSLPPASNDGLALIAFTSGSTGLAKGVCYHHRHLIAQAQSLQNSFGFRFGEKDLCTFPLFALLAPILGMTSVIPQMDFSHPGRTDPRPMIAAINHYQISNMFGSPALIHRLVSTKTARVFAPLRRLIMAGAPVSPGLVARGLQHLTKGQLFTPYGATEALPVSLIDGEEILKETSRKTIAGRGLCVGRPVTGTQVDIMPIKDTHQEVWQTSTALPVGEIGEIVVSGPQVSDQYDANPVANHLGKMRDQKTGHGWHRMGDLGYFDDQGRLWFCGRKSQRIRMPLGELYPDMCEAVFNAHEKIYRSGLVGIGDVGQEKPVLFVESRQPLTKPERIQVHMELTALGAQFKETQSIHDIRFLKCLPVDPRHNAKIVRESLKLRAKPTRRPREASL